jgi:hypothetical protein
MQVNLVPQTARAWVNHRVHPADGSDLEKATRTLSHAPHVHADADARSRAHDHAAAHPCAPTHTHSLTRPPAHRQQVLAYDRRVIGDARVKLEARDFGGSTRGGAAAAALPWLPPAPVEPSRHTRSVAPSSAIYSFGVGRLATSTSTSTSTGRRRPVSCALMKPPPSVALARCPVPMRVGGRSHRRAAVRSMRSSARRGMFSMRPWHQCS